MAIENDHEPLQASMRSGANELGGLAERIADTTGQAFYVWDIKTDKLEWSRGFLELMGFGEDETRHLTGRSYEGLLGAKSHDTRFGKIFSGDVAKSDGPVKSEAVNFQCTYLIQINPDDETTAVWLEDTGCWYPDDAGRPMRAEGSIRIITERRKHDEEMRRLSDFDELTNLPNRRALEKLINNCVVKANTDGSSAVFIILALQGLDVANDIYGFESGDFVLRKVGKIIRSKLRAGDSVCRFSGSKFGIILNKCAPAEIYDAGDRLLNAIANEVIQAPGGHVSISASIGACFIPQHAQTPNQAYQAAFLAMKNSGNEKLSKVGVYCHNPEETEKFHLQAGLSTQIVKALEKNQIELCYQPVVGSDYKPAFYEALARIRLDDGEVISASKCIDIAERLGLIKIVDRRVLELALDTLRDYPDAVLSINVSNDTLMDAQWLEIFKTRILQIDNAASRLIVEITETMAVTSIGDTKRFVEMIKSYGCRTAIDDFGAGFTSFANLKMLPIDIVKIDGSFGLNIANNDENQTFVKALLSLTKAFGIQTVVEWIEDQESATMLFEWEADYLQGYQFGMASGIAPWKKLEDTEADSDNTSVA